LIGRPIRATIEHMSDRSASSWWEPGALQLQGSLFGFDEPAVDESFTRLRRIELDAETWVDHQPTWLVGDQVVFDRLIMGLEWRQRTVEVWERLLDEPRLTSWWSASDGPERLPILALMRRVLSDRYGETFDSIGFNLYRRGEDSVAWHGDRHREVVENPVVAIVSTGAPRPFRLRPAGGGRSLAFDLGIGDLLVMGGACQHRWEHCVPKLRHAEPRLSITFRHGARRRRQGAGARVRRTAAAMRSADGR